MYRFIRNIIIFSSAFVVSQNALSAISSETYLQQANNEIHNIDTVTLQKQIKEQPDTVLIDVRTQFEIEQLGTIGLYQNRNIPRGWLEFRIKDEAKSFDTPIVVYCGTNVRSPLAAKKLMEMGYTNVKNYSDTYFKWQKAGLPLYLSSVANDSLLYKKPKKVIDDVYTAIGATQPGTYANSGHNNNLSFIVGDDAVVVFNAGGSYLLAQAMHEEIKKVTDLPIKYVVYENAQGHAVFGGSYWKDYGATIVGHEYTPEILDHTKEQMVERAQRSLRDKYFKTRIVYPDITFKDSMKLDIKGKNIVLGYFGHAHSPDDIHLVMPDEKLLISGDFAFNERLLPILPHTDAHQWIENWEKIEKLNPDIIIPGHGDVTKMPTVRYFTIDYLKYMVTQVTEIIENDGTLMQAYDIDQSAFRDWKTFRELSRQNSDRLFRALEFY